jgi:hypothetical protein
MGSVAVVYSFTIFNFDSLERQADNKRTTGGAVLKGAASPTYTDKLSVSENIFLSIGQSLCYNWLGHPLYFSHDQENEGENGYDEKF